MDLTIASKKQLEYEKRNLHNCIFLAFCFGEATQRYWQQKLRFPCGGGNPGLAKISFSWLELIEKRDAEALKWTLSACSRAVLEMMIEDLGDDGAKYRKYLGMLD